MGHFSEKYLSLDKKIYLLRQIYTAYAYAVVQSSLQGFFFLSPSCNLGLHSCIAKPRKIRDLSSQYCFSSQSSLFKALALNTEMASGQNEINTGKRPLSFDIEGVKLFPFQILNLIINRQYGFTFSFLFIETKLLQH